MLPARGRHSPYCSAARRPRARGCSAGRQIGEGGRQADAVSVPVGDICLSPQCHGLRLCLQRCYVWPISVRLIPSDPNALARSARYVIGAATHVSRHSATASVFIETAPASRAVSTREIPWFVRILPRSGPCLADRQRTPPATTQWPPNSTAPHHHLSPGCSGWPKIRQGPRQAHAVPTRISRARLPPQRHRLRIRQHRITISPQVALAGPKIRQGPRQAHAVPTPISRARLPPQRHRLRIRQHRITISRCSGWPQNSSGPSPSPRRAYPDQPRTPPATTPRQHDKRTPRGRRATDPQVCTHIPRYDPQSASR